MTSYVKKEIRCCLAVLCRSSLEVRNFLLCVNVLQIQLNKQHQHPYLLFVYHLRVSLQHVHAHRTNPGRPGALVDRS